MKQHFFNSFTTLFFGSFFILSVFINNSSIASSAVTRADIYKVPVTGMLDNLWAEAAAFKHRKGKTVFVFRFWLNDSITLKGWHSKGLQRHKFNPEPDIELHKGAASGVAYPPGTYFGNVMLQRSDIKKIRHMLKDAAAQYIVFIPKIENQQIFYTIYTSSVKPDVSDKQFIDQLTLTGASANPSPPKQYNYRSL